MKRKEFYKMKTFQISEDIKNVSRVGLGCMRLTEKKTDQEVRAIVDTALENGINFLTMQIFMRQERRKQLSERFLTPSLREQVVIQTNVPSVRESALIFQKSIF